MPFYKLAEKSELTNGYRKAFSVEDHSLLLIQEEDEIFLIENKCGHFGVPMEQAQITGTTFICREHGISFDLKTGAVSNRPWENCDPLKVFEVHWDGDSVGLLL